MQKKVINTIQVYVFPLYIYGRLEYPRPVTHTCHHKLFKYILQGFKNIHCNIWITLCLKVINSSFCWQKSQDPAFHNQLLGASAAWVPAEHVTCFKCWGRPYMSVINYLRCSYFIVWFIHSQFLTELSPSCPADNQSLGLFKSTRLTHRGFTAYSDFYWTNTWHQGTQFVLLLSECLAL